MLVHVLLVKGVVTGTRNLVALQLGVALLAAQGKCGRRFSCGEVGEYVWGPGSWLARAVELTLD